MATVKNTRENNININDKITIHIMTTLSELWIVTHMLEMVGI